MGAYAMSRWSRPELLCTNGNPAKIRPAFGDAPRNSHLVRACAAQSQDQATPFDPDAVRDFLQHILHLPLNDGLMHVGYLVDFSARIVQEGNPVVPTESQPPLALVGPTKP